MSTGTHQLLTVRELEVLRLVADGRTARAISTELGVGVVAVRNCTRRIVAKFGARNRAHAVAVAMRAGIIT